MSESAIRQQADDIHHQLPEGVDATRGDIHDRLDTLVNDYKVPLDEARRSVLSTYLDDTDRDQANRDATPVDISSINEPDQWVDVTAKVVELWEPRSDAVAQVGLLGDETGTIKFTAWSKSDLPELAEDHVYQLEGVVTDEYQGRYSVKFNRTTTITERDEPVEVGDNSTDAEAALVDIQSGSGLIM